jgi:hypothetical protein
MRKAAGWLLSYKGEELKSGEMLRLGSLFAVRPSLFARPEAEALTPIREGKLEVARGSMARAFGRFFLAKSEERTAKSGNRLSFSLLLLVYIG